MHPSLIKQAIVLYLWQYGDSIVIDHLWATEQAIKAFCPHFPDSILSVRSVSSGDSNQSSLDHKPFSVQRGTSSYPFGLQKTELPPHSCSARSHMHIP